MISFLQRMEIISQLISRDDPDINVRKYYGEN
jgi:hypothetical protein